MRARETPSRNAPTLRCRP